MKFTVNDMEFQPMQRSGAIRLEIIKALDALPDGSLLTADGLASRLKRSTAALQNKIAPALGADIALYRYRDGNRYLYGSKKTVSALHAKSKN